MTLIPLTDDKSKQPVFVNPALIQAIELLGFKESRIVYRYKHNQFKEFIDVAEEPDEVLEKIRLYSIMGS